MGAEIAPAVDPGARPDDDPGRSPTGEGVRDVGDARDPRPGSPPAPAPPTEAAARPGIGDVRSPRPGRAPEREDGAGRPRVVGMAWYRREDYGRLRETMADADRLPATFERWLASAEQVAGEVERSGVAVTRVLIAPDVFAAWCEARGLRRDGAARSRFASEGS